MAGYIRILCSSVDCNTTPYIKSPIRGPFSRNFQYSGGLRPVSMLNPSGGLPVISKPFNLICHRENSVSRSKGLLSWAIEHCGPNHISLNQKTYHKFPHRSV